MLIQHMPRATANKFRFVEAPTFVRPPELILPTPHLKQKGLVESEMKRAVIVAGRRGGKTTGLAIKAARAFIKGARVLYAAPTTDQTERFWYAVRSYLQPRIDAQLLYKSETKRLIEPYGVDENGPRIRAKTAFNADTLRGDFGDLVLLDEYQLMSPDVDDVVLPMMLDTNGTTIYGGTPLRKNHFFAKYVMAKSNPDRWAYWHYTSYDNPNLSNEAIKSMVEDMTSSAYRQEIMAEFLDNEGQVFSNLNACLNSPGGLPSHHKGHVIVAGVDWGKQQDYTVFSLFCVTCSCEVFLYRKNQIEYRVQRKRLEKMTSEWGINYILAEQNSIGEPIIEELRAVGLPVFGFQTTFSSKPPLIQSLQLCFEHAEAQWLPDEIARAELEAFEQTISPSGRPKYSAPEGVHDDTVIARALAWEARIFGGEQFIEF